MPASWKVTSESKPANGTFSFNRPPHGHKDPVLNFSEIRDALTETRPERQAALYSEADRVRRENVGDEIHLRGLIEISNQCAKDCHYCGLRAANRAAYRYRMTIDEIFQAAKNTRALGIETVVIQSGETGSYETKELCTLISRIKELGVAVTLSLGEKTKDQYRAYRDAGADRYLLKFETSDPVLFARLKPDSIFEERFRCLTWLRELGYQVGSGIMVGLPGQTPDILAQDILHFRELDLHMIGVGPFIPHPETPLAAGAPGTVETALTAMALTRLVMPLTNIPATTSIEVMAPGGRERALLSGANVVMPNMTPVQHRPHYEIYPNDARRPGAPTGIEPILSLARRLNRPVATGPGHSLAYSK